MERSEGQSLDHGLAAELSELKADLRQVRAAESAEGKIAILYQNDDYGKDYVKGLKDGLGDKAKTMIVSELPYEPADPTVDSQIINLKASGADIFFNVTTPKFAAQAIKKCAEIGWKPMHLLNNVSVSVGSGDEAGRL